ncbi:MULTISPECIES: YfiR family protein [Pseudodesulfovibrio]|uniref:Transmembrane protein n=1 Tax=Pseudodesulfovibrio aespoeensis (strain ATCC 700646 / DSM 10631 / Aspo-2) TaxID=643562 RepID=E6VTE5_PSEA9|nr:MULTISPECIES: YfiR family protein [Pseudodesulfovibrio]ADU62122.1 hypothetical protein Daes_1106 [Pseudodesulfovibrio aespoeensis Aspo-2]MCG2732008.1 YfiR family protein [Pseudodesulfovibrio aespoeensis]
MGFLMDTGKGLFVAALLAALLLTPIPALPGSSPRTATGDQLRALFVQRLVRYVTWPEDAAPADGEPVIVAATDAESLRPYFDDAGDSGGFRLVQWPVDTCHVLVLAGAPDRSAAAILQWASRRPVLTVGQSPASLRMGAVVNLFLSDGKLKLEINPEAAERAGLDISSRLLGLARIYHGGDNAR